jgi:glycerol kinase
MMQMQSDILKIPVKQQVDKEKTAAGVAYMAGLKLGLWNLKFLKNKKDFNIFKPEKNISLENAHKNWVKQIKLYINKNDGK